MSHPLTLLRTLAFVVFAASTATGCVLGQGRPPGIAPGLDVVQGTATYRETTPLPADAVLDIRIVDVSPMTDAGAVLAERTMPSDGRQVPIPFAIGYDPDRAMSDRSYAVRMTIRGGGKALFVTESDSLVITKGHGREVHLILVPAGGLVPTN
jgi:putative lipoprotein